METNETKWEFKKVHATVPIDLFEEIRDMRLFSKIDNIVVKALREFVEEEKRRSSYGRSGKQY